MTKSAYTLSCANLPFDLCATDPEADALFAAVPASLMEAFQAKGHQEQVHAGDEVASWIARNWRNVLPVLSARFPLPLPYC